MKILFFPFKLLYAVLAGLVLTILIAPKLIMLVFKSKD